MNTREAFQLLTLASARDGRTVDVEVATVWADDLAYIPLEDAVEAARMHYRESSAWLMPAHVTANVKRIREQRDREERVRRQLEPPKPLPADDEGIKAYWAEVQRLKELKK